jgi:hypothetical protein
MLFSLDRGILTSSLIPQVKRSALVGPAAHIAHLEIYLPHHSAQGLTAGGEVLALIMRSNADGIIISII